MKTIGLEQTTLDACVNDAQRERIVLTRGGKPVALLVGLEGLDREQVERGGDERFWTLIAERRAQPTIDRGELERRLNPAD